ncbi:ParA family protein [Micromonospora sp. DT4]|uniref:ParA family protein n=1 Tax=Micromonospora sp. DT4 TaxID=3393438 RepID=UPI003CEB1298
MSVTALALSLSWQRDTILAECDPAGGDVLPGFLAGQMPADRGIGELSSLHGRGRLEAEWWGQLVDLDAPHRRRLLLPGVARLADSGGVATVGDTVASLFAGLAEGPRPYDVIADCGRLNAINTLWPVLQRADALVMVVRGTLPSIAHARANLTDLRERHAHTPRALDALRLLVIDEGKHVREAAATLGVPLLGVLPHDPRSARELSQGGTRIKAHHRLVRACRDLHAPLAEVMTSSRLRHGAMKLETADAG